jgi:hypothetical protein
MVKEYKKLYHANIDQKKEDVATLISFKIEFKAKNIIGGIGNVIE